jgi:hypothetical protein
MSTDQRIFISYRRSDCQSQANGLNDGLRNRLPGAQVFMDLDSIPPGADFEEHIRSEIDQCDVVLVLIGDEWLAPRPGTSTRRIDQPNDFVRLEVMSALGAQGVRVIPVLVEGATMPEASELPDDIARLARLNAYVLSDTHWARDITELTNYLRGARPQAQAQIGPEPTVTFADIDANAVKYAVAALPRQFATKEVSTHPAMLATHEDVAQRSNYHTMVGRFLLQHRIDLGLDSPEAPQDERGSRWTKVAAPGVPAAPVPVAPSPPRSFVPSVPPPASSDGGRSSAGKWMIALPMISFGLLSFVPPIWAAGRAKQDPVRRRRLYLMAGALVIGLLIAFVLIGTSPTNAEGTATGTTSNIGAVLYFGCMVAGVVIAVRNRRPPTVLAGVSEQLARRDLRQQYRQLVGRDPALAASMHVGRPDLVRDYADGGLIDITSRPADGLERYAGMSAAEAAEVLRARAQLGRLAGLNELEAFSSLSQSTLTRLHDIAVFV